MFSDQFYPTPDEVIDQMVEPYVSSHTIPSRFGDYETKSLPFNQILEPSAGKGNICDRLVKKYNVEAKKLYCIELDWELQDTLRGKGYRVIDTDFLKHTREQLFDAVILNPPWNEGAAHVLKAWEVLDHGVVIALLNAETVRNPFSEERKILGRLIDAFGSTKEIGQAFLDAERTTDAEAVIVWLEKPRKDSDVPDFEPSRMDFDAKVEEPEFNENQLARADIIGAIVDQYNAAVLALVEMHKAEQRLKYYMREVGASKMYSRRDDQREYMEREDREEQRRAPETLNKKLMDLKAEFWKYVFRKTKIGTVTTSNFQRKFQHTQNEIANLAFTADNILYVLETFLFNREAIIEECIVNVFDKATSYHVDNKEHVEGWKSNKDYRLARRIVIPWGISYDKKFNYWSYYYSGTDDFYGDLDKALCFLSGRSMDSERDPFFRSISWAINNHIACIRNGTRYDLEFESTFCRIRFFKKGTVHLYIKDQDLLNRFNIAAARGKKWVGSGN